MALTHTAATTNHRLLIVSPRDRAIPPTAPAPVTEISIHVNVAPNRRAELAGVDSPMSCSTIILGRPFKPSTPVSGVLPSGSARKRVLIIIAGNHHGILLHHHRGLFVPTPALFDRMSTAASGLACAKFERLAMRAIALDAMRSAPARRDRSRG